MRSEVQSFLGTPILYGTTTMKEKYLLAFMKVAQTFAELSSAVRLKVGAIAVKDNRIISIGYNGMPAGDSNVCEELVVTTDESLIDSTWTFNPVEKNWHRLVTKPEVLHAERNVLDKLAGSTESGKGATMFVTHSPCLECAKSIYGAGISEVYYLHDYRRPAGVQFLTSHGVKVTKLSFPTEDM